MPSFCPPTAFHRAPTSLVLIPEFPTWPIQGRAILPRFRTTLGHNRAIGRSQGTRAGPRVSPVPARHYRLGSVRFGKILSDPAQLFGSSALERIHISRKNAIIAVMKSANRRLPAPAVDPATFNDFRFFLNCAAVFFAACNLPACPRDQLGGRFRQVALLHPTAVRDMYRSRLGARLTKSVAGARAFEI